MTGIGSQGIQLLYVSPKQTDASICERFSAALDVVLICVFVALYDEKNVVAVRCDFCLLNLAHFEPT